MAPHDTGACGELATVERCDAALPDDPRCAPNYHFGMLLGVDDFRAEQGFHLGRSRRHQRVLHGRGVVAGFTVEIRGDELRVGPGHAVDALGRDLVVEQAQCVSLPLWWKAHRGDDAFADIATPDDALLDLDVVVCYSSCLGSPVPAIADPCAGDAADVAYSRVCERGRLALVRTPADPPPAGERPFHLLRMWLHGIPPRTGGDGKPLASDQWLLDRRDAIESLPPAEQASRRAKLLRAVIAKSVAELSPYPPEDGPEEAGHCVLLARLRDVRLKLDADGWKVTAKRTALGVRDSLLPTWLLQDLLLGEHVPGAPAAGPTVLPGGASLAADDVTLSLVFDQPLAAASVAAPAFAVSEFVDATGWKPFTPGAPVHVPGDPAGPTVQLTLDRAATGSLVRVTVIGTGSAPLLGASLVAAGAVHPAGDGRNVSTSIFRGQP